MALAGCLLYLAVTAAVLNSSTFKGAQFIKSEYSADDDPSWKFRNPEFNEWLAQIKSEKDSLASRQQQLKEWQTRLDAELQEVSAVTQTVAQLQANFDKNVIRFKDAQADNEKHQAKLLSAMSPEGAIAMLDQMPDNDVVRILFLMKADVASQILDTMSKMSNAQAKRAALLTEKLRQVLPPVTTANNP